MGQSQNSNSNAFELNHANYHFHREKLLQNLKALPPTELHYYFAILVATIGNQTNPEQHTQLLINTNDVVEKLNKYYTDVKNNISSDLTPVTEALNALILSTHVQTIPYKIKVAALSVCSVMTGFLFGVLGATSGLIAGLVSDYTIIGNLRSAGLGFLTGLSLGVFAGSQTPGLIFQSSFERKLAFCMDSILKVGGELAHKKTHAEYEGETKKYILNEFFKDTPEEEKEGAFNAFLESTNQEFQVSTITAGFIFPSLKGHLGHHTLIAYSINGKKATPIEYGDRIKTPRFFDQNETPRVVSGRTLFSMLVLDRILQETYKYTLEGYARDYVIGSNDCRNYVDKVLVGTGQPATKIERFNPITDSWLGTEITGRIVRFFSTIDEKELWPLRVHYKNDPDEPEPTITARKWPGKNQ